MEKWLGLTSRLKNERGATAVLVSILMVVFIGLTALAVDVGHLYVVHNELQNAADAGALAGARFLHTEDGSAVNTGADTIAHNAAVANMSDGLPVEVNIGDVQRGHWSSDLRTFSPDDSEEEIVLFDHTIFRKEYKKHIIDAVKQTVRRETTPATTYFGKIFGIQNFSMQALAIAYIGFAGSLNEGEVDLPIAICKESLLTELGEYQCTSGRMINIGENVANSETGGWTDFNQDGCGANAGTVGILVSGDGNPEVIMYGKDMATDGGGMQFAFDELRERWIDETNQDQPWNLTLPVVTCSGNNVGGCREVVGAVNIDIVWITGAEDDLSYDDAPMAMYNPNTMLPWSGQGIGGEERWQSFIATFNLVDINDEEKFVPYQKETIYFVPDCNSHVPTGGTGGENFGVLAKVPVLVD